MITVYFILTDAQGNKHETNASFNPDSDIYAGQGPEFCREHAETYFRAACTVVSQQCSQFGVGGIVSLTCSNTGEHMLALY